MSKTRARCGGVGKLAILRVEFLEVRLNPVTWPVPVSHEIMTGFADGSPPNVYHFHEGIDVVGNGQGGQRVVAARAGKIVRLDPGYVGGRVAVKVDLGGGSFEVDGYLHTVPKAGLNLNDDVVEGQELGTISTTAYESPVRHLHFEVTTVVPTGEFVTPEDTYLNPFMRFAAAADRDPLGNSPTLRDTNNDNKTLLVTPNGDYANPFPEQPIKGDVDLIADAVDPMNSTLTFVANPHSIGYYVKPLFDQGLAAPLARGVKTAAAPYVLAKYDDAWFKGIAGPPAVATSTKFNEVYDEHHPVHAPAFPWVRLEHEIVTNTKGTDGKIDNVDENQYWNTNAQEDNAADWINYAGKPDAAKNAEARFKDGDYEAHITLSDLATSVDKKAAKMRVVNFVRKAGVDLGGQPSNQGLNPILYSQSDAPWVPDFNPTPVVAPISRVFWLGDMVGTNGEQYYPNMPMGVYVHSHRAGGWNNGDDLTAGAIAFTIGESNADGVIPLTQTWLANALGKYDVIVDYDNDGLFSWKLDGVTGFIVATIIIGDWVWGDINPEGPNGIQDSWEIWGSPGITVKLYKADGTFVDSTVTGENGYYSIPVAEEVPTWYYLEFVKPLGAYFSPKDTGPDDKDSDADPNTGLTDPFPSPQFFGEWLDDTRDCGMYAIAAFQPPTNDPPDPTPPPPPGSAGNSVPSLSMDLTPGGLTQFGHGSTGITFVEPNSASTWSPADGGQTTQPDDGSLTTLQVVARASGGIDTGIALLDNLTTATVGIVTAAQPLWSDQLLDGDPLHDRVGHTGSSL